MWFSLEQVGFASLLQVTHHNLDREMLVLHKLMARMNKNKYNCKKLLSILEDVVQLCVGAAQRSDGIITFSDCVVTFSELILQFNNVKGVQVVRQTVNRSLSWYRANLVTKWAGDLAWWWKV